ncbi:hypothetical protein MRX96_058268 [Rhipicephalus microplus]
MCPRERRRSNRWASARPNCARNALTRPSDGGAPEVASVSGASGLRDVFISAVKLWREDRANNSKSLHGPLGYPSRRNPSFTKENDSVFSFRCLVNLALPRCVIIKRSVWQADHKRRASSSLRT